MDLKKIGHIVLIPLLLGGCIYPIDPPSEGYENLLVVEAVLTDGDDPFEVKLSRSIPINTNELVPEEHAHISISENSEVIYDLYEVNAGRYMAYDLKAKAGNNYQLIIETADGKQYTSDPVLLKNTPPIDSVFFKYEERVTTESEILVPGLQIYVTTHDVNKNTWYYRWEFVETWEFRTKYNSTLKWEDGILKEREEQINQCWKYDRSLNVLVTTSKNLNEDIIYEFPITYISNATDRLISKYSILVKQYALSERSFNYWKDLEKLNENLGTLFDPQPYMLEGNIHNVNDPNEVVLGYFDASAVQEKRIFISRGEFPYFSVRDYYESCVDTVGSYGLIPEFILQGFMLVGQLPPEGWVRVYQFSSPGCVDCRFAGTNVRPDFWE
jgi:hypothetical protein